MQMVCRKTTNAKILQFRAQVRGASLKVEQSYFKTNGLHENLSIYIPPPPQYCIKPNSGDTEQYKI